jgi:hypothetical protein
MNTHRRTAAIVGALFLLSNITFLLGAFVFVEPILGAPDYLTLASANGTQVVLGSLLELVNGIAYIGIAVLMFPILRNYLRTSFRAIIAPTSRSGGEHGETEAADAHLVGSAGWTVGTHRTALGKSRPSQTYRAQAGESPPGAGWDHLSSAHGLSMESHPTRLWGR